MAKPRSRSNLNLVQAWSTLVKRAPGLQLTTGVPHEARYNISKPRAFLQQVYKG